MKGQNEIKEINKLIHYFNILINNLFYFNFIKKYFVSIL